MPNEKEIKNLVIVESPAKAKTIEKYLGADYKVTSSVGHIRDLPKKGMSIDIENGFIPNYEINPDKKKVVTELRKLAKNSENVWLATDEDREGEAIAWHLLEALKLDIKTTKRIVFHEITKNAIQEAIKKPRTVDKHLVDAQQARRVLDRLVGYELSPVLWRKVQLGLSAGRVQSVAVRLIVEREREVDAFENKSYFKITANFHVGDGKIIKAELNKKYDEYDDAKKLMEKLLGKEFTISDIKKKPSTRKPAAPFTTSTLQQEASRKLGFTVKQTMVVAQKLYENGHITYMRTDSLNLSETAISAAAQKIESEFGSNYVQTRKYTTKSSGAQEAHEAIRPTDMDKSEVKLERNLTRLYDLIWKRTVASQMKDALIEKTTATISINGLEEFFTASGEVIKFDGFLKLYIEDTDEDADDSDDQKILPPLTVGSIAERIDAEAKELFKRPPARYTEASLVKKLEEMGIGRPSTYAPTISTIQDRGYVEKADKEGVDREYRVIIIKEQTLSEAKQKMKTGAEKSKLFPTDVGGVVTDFLKKHFESIVDYNFTAEVELEFDEISKGGKQWNKMISDFYGGFKETIDKSSELSRTEAKQARLVGEHPKTGKPIYATIAKYGPVVQMGGKDEEEKPKFAAIPKNLKIDKITLEEAVQLFELPRTVGIDEEGEKYQTQIGRFGPYVKYKNVFASIKDEQIFGINLEEAQAIIKEKIEIKNNSTINEFEKIGLKILKGRYGPYITNGKKNVKIPKGFKPEELTEEGTLELFNKAPEKKTRRKAAPKK